MSLFKAVIKLMFVILFHSITDLNAEFYSSVHTMLKLVKYENFFLKQMHNFLIENESKLEFLKAQLTEFERERDEAISEGPAYVENPVNKYLLTKRLTVDWQRIQNLMEHDSGQKILKNVHDFTEKKEMPSSEELEGAIEGLLRLQDIYRLKTKDIAAGILQGVQYNTELEARHCFDLGKFAVTQNKTLLGHSWLVESLERLRLRDDNVRQFGRLANNFQIVEEPLSEVDILVSLAEAKHKLGDIKGANETYAEVLELRPADESLAKTYAQFIAETMDNESQAIDYSEEHAPLPEDYTQADQDTLYKLTCSGNLRSTLQEDSYLQCGYMTETHPFLLLAPLKVEELSLDPLLVMYYDVLSDKEIDIMKGLAKGKIIRATVMGLNGSEISKVRTSQFVFLPYTEHIVLEKIDRRVEDMTNLNMKYAEEHQFANYGIGGHYAQHHDYFDMSSELVKQTSYYEMGNRIATVLFYLSDVEQGGGTAFPYLKRLVLPKKGSAMFWYNLHATTETDERTLHGACPIIVGSKWVQNRWIRAHFQDDRRPCHLYIDNVERL